MSPYPGITRDGCEQAFRIALGSLRVAVDLEVANKLAGTFVTIDPFRVPSSMDPSLVSLEEARDAALFVGRVDDNHEGAEKYDKIALSKVRDVWVLRAALGPDFLGRDIQQRFPHLYRRGMTKWHGAACRSGVPMAFSGVQGNYDEAFVVGAAAWLEAASREEMTRAGGVMASESSFIE